MRFTDNQMHEFYVLAPRETDNKGDLMSNSVYYKMVNQSGETIEMTTRPLTLPADSEIQTLEVQTPDCERVNPYLAKKCPFCGTRPGFSFEGDQPAQTGAEIECENSHCTGGNPRVVAQDIETALKTWNARHGEKKRSMTPKQEECLQEALESLAILEQPPMEACDVKYQDSHQEAIECIKKHLQMALEDDEDAIMIKLQENNKGACKIVTDFGVGGMQRWEGTSSGAVMAEIFKSIQKVSEPEE